MLGELLEIVQSVRRQGRPLLFGEISVEPGLGQRSFQSGAFFIELLHTDNGRIERIHTGRDCWWQHTWVRRRQLLRRQERRRNECEERENDAHQIR